jgi:hypothetical protein
MVFCRRYQLKVHHHGQIGAQDKEAEIKIVIIINLELLKSVLFNRKGGQLNNVELR